MPESRGQFLSGSAMSPVTSVVGPDGDRGSEMPVSDPKLIYVGSGRMVGNSESETIRSGSPNFPY